ncbi:MAG: hypothetical protein AABY15_00620 [Nanoarchaeota archaeon]
MKKLTTDLIVDRCKEVHGDKYNYSSVKYKNSSTKIKIKCPEHGVFEQRFHDHINGSGCPFCSGVGRLDTKSFIKRAKEIHGDKYDYSKSYYVNTETKVKISCLEHGVFEQTPHDHLYGKGCLNCGYETTANSHINSNEYFLKRARIIHGDRYEYIDEYSNQHSKVSIKCEIHGIFRQKPKYHLQGNGCPICKESKGEKEVAKFLKQKGILFERQKRFNNCKNISTLPFDFYLPDYNVCIEYNGRQHYTSIDNWGGEKMLKDLQERDKIKSEYCKNNRISLIVINYLEDVLDCLENIHIFMKN